MQTDKRLYLALLNLMEEFTIDGTSSTKDAYQEAYDATGQFEQELGPLPDWATGFNVAGDLLLFSQLYTKDGRKRGNGMIYHVAGSTYGVITDMGNTMTLSREELLGIYEIGEFILNEDGYLKRLRQNEEHWRQYHQPEPEE